MGNQLEKNTGNFTKLAADFIQTLEIFPGSQSIDNVKPSEDWQVIGEFYPNKVKAINPSAGVFIKYYPPDCNYSKGYAEAINRTLEELSQIPDLELPVLAPLAISNGALIFKQGIYKKTTKYRFLEPRTQEKITAIVEKNGLEPLGLFGRIEIVEVDGQDFLVDPVDDSVYMIHQFAENLAILNPDFES